MQAVSRSARPHGTCFHTTLTPSTPFTHAGCVQVSQTTRDLLVGHTFIPTGGVEIKGKVGAIRGLCLAAYHVVMSYVMYVDPPPQHTFPPPSLCCRLHGGFASQGMMKTHLWIPNEHPEEEYVNTKEKALVSPGTCTGFCLLI